MISRAVSQANINPKKFQESIRIPLPSVPEQTRIAAALSSLDDLIAMQGEKIAALQTFKRGLLQGLFPAAVSADASATQEAADD